MGKSLLIRSGREPEDISSIVVCTADGQALADSQALLCISQNLVGPVSWLGTVCRFLVPVPLLDRVLEFLSKNRYQLLGGEYDSCRLDFDGEYDNRFVLDPEVW